MPLSLGKACQAALEVLQHKEFLLQSLPHLPSTPLLKRGTWDNSMWLQWLEQQCQCHSTLRGSGQGITYSQRGTDFKKHTSPHFLLTSLAAPDKHDPFLRHGILTIHYIESLTQNCRFRQDTQKLSCTTLSKCVCGYKPQFLSHCCIHRKNHSLVGSKWQLCHASRLHRNQYYK